MKKKKKNRVSVEWRGGVSNEKNMKNEEVNKLK